ncbi:MAG: epoxyqueuosine reductase QueH [Proteobacteria bacterium]|nr:epoxyqueuosine reductase QueH [Pseudomonadota bacterium]MBU1737153.1 epoxyqueuosine reductase QueH [Pseudomonadota bacterium]
MNLLLHICCGPCTTYPFKTLTAEGHTIQGYFHNPNIHPYREFQRRISALEEFCRQTGMEVEYDREYGLKEYLRKVVFNEENRCRTCYEMRLAETARKAATIGADAFSTTLLYSRFQKHDRIREIGEKMASEYGVSFYYRDFREGWREGIDLAIERGLYRQPYCGCIYSEQERYEKRAG